MSLWDAKFQHLVHYLVQHPEIDLLVSNLLPILQQQFRIPIQDRKTLYCCQLTLAGINHSQYLELKHKSTSNNLDIRYLLFVQLSISITHLEQEHLIRLFYVENHLGLLDVLCDCFISLLGYQSLTPYFKIFVESLNQKLDDSQRSLYLLESLIKRLLRGLSQRTQDLSRKQQIVDCYVCLLVFYKRLQNRHRMMKPLLFLKHVFGHLNQIGLWDRRLFDKMHDIYTNLGQELDTSMAIYCQLMALLYRPSEKEPLQVDETILLFGEWISHDPQGLAFLLPLLLQLSCSEDNWDLLSQLLSQIQNQKLQKWLLSNAITRSTEQDLRDTNHISHKLPNKQAVIKHRLWCLHQLRHLHPHTFISLFDEKGYEIRVKCAQIMALHALNKHKRSHDFDSCLEPTDLQSAFGYYFEQLSLFLSSPNNDREMESFALFGFYLVKHIVCTCPITSLQDHESLWKHLMNQILSWHLGIYNQRTQQLCQIVCSFVMGSCIRHYSKRGMTHQCHLPLLRQFLPLLYKFRTQSLAVRMQVFELCDYLLGRPIILSQINQYDKELLSIVYRLVQGEYLVSKAPLVVKLSHMRPFEPLDSLDNDKRVLELGKQLVESMYQYFLERMLDPDAVADVRDPILPPSVGESPVKRALFSDPPVDRTTTVLRSTVDPTPTTVLRQSLTNHNLDKTHSDILKTPPKDVKWQDTSMDHLLAKIDKEIQQQTPQFSPASSLTKLLDDDVGFSAVLEQGPEMVEYSILNKSLSSVPDHKSDQKEPKSSPETVNDFKPNLDQKMSDLSEFLQSIQASKDTSDHKQSPDTPNEYLTPAQSVDPDSVLKRDADHFKQQLDDIFKQELTQSTREQQLEALATSIIQEYPIERLASSVFQESSDVKPLLDQQSVAEHPIAVEFVVEHPLEQQSVDQPKVEQPLTPKREPNFEPPRSSTPIPRTDNLMHVGEIASDTWSNTSLEKAIFKDQSLHLSPKDNLKSPDGPPLQEPTQILEQGILDASKILENSNLQHQTLEPTITHIVQEERYSRFDLDDSRNFSFIVQQRHPMLSHTLLHPIQYVIRHLIFSKTKSTIDYQQIYSTGLLNGSHISLNGDNLIVQEPLHPVLKQVLQQDAHLLVDLCQDLTLLTPSRDKWLEMLSSVHRHLIPLSKQLFKLETKFPLSVAQAMVIVKDKIKLVQMMTHPLATKTGLKTLKSAASILEGDSVFLTFNTLLDWLKLTKDIMSET
ncbi:hypothetical protein EDD86DRAFT_215026 [Gorgonomyces haynaldii]|nr:hypothetical protein EDD86DRAFT_215026 [Gorgonomyces haynaldii]